MQVRTNGIKNLELKFVIYPFNLVEVKAITVCSIAEIIFRAFLFFLVLVSLPKHNKF